MMTNLGIFRPAFEEEIETGTLRPMYSLTQLRKDLTSLMKNSVADVMVSRYASATALITGGYWGPADRDLKNQAPLIGSHLVPPDAARITPVSVNVPVSGGRVSGGGRFVRRWLIFEDRSGDPLMMFPNYGWDRDRQLMPWAAACGLELEDEVPPIWNKPVDKIVPRYFKIPHMEPGLPPRSGNRLWGFGRTDWYLGTPVEGPRQ